jgi:hypothetical protein
MISESHGATATSAVSYGDVLIEGAGSLDRRGVDALGLPDGVSAAVAANSALLCAGLGETTRILNHVVLNQRVCRPAVDRQGAQAASDAEGAAVSNGAAGVLVGMAEGTIGGYLSYAVLPGFQPTPTTKSSLVLKLREKPPLEGVKLTVPPVL